MARETVIYRIEKWTPELVLIVVEILIGHGAEYEVNGNGFLTITHDRAGMDQVMADAKNSNIFLKRMAAIE